jgi:hypothetical protein
MIISRLRRSTAMGIGALAALTLVLVCGGPIFADWVGGNTRNDNAGGLFLRTLAWPQWSLDSGTDGWDLLALDLKAILVVVFTAVFLTLLADAETARMRGAFAALITGWSAYLLAGALAGFVSALFSATAGLYTALTWAQAGAGYGILTGWIIGLAQMSARRP